MHHYMTIHNASEVPFCHNVLGHVGLVSVFISYMLNYVDPTLTRHQIDAILFTVNTYGLAQLSNRTSNTKRFDYPCTE